MFGDQDPHGPNVALFVGSLPPNLNEKQYETILLDYLDDSESAPSSSLEHSCPLVGRLSILILKYYSFHCQNFQLSDFYFRESLDAWIMDSHFGELL